MKCESCGNELTGGAIICRVCNHNNALRGDWRKQHTEQESAARRTGEMNAKPKRTTAPLTELPKIIPRKDIDANLIHFPPASNTPEGKPEGARVAPTTVASQSSTETDSGAGKVITPPWRDELKERVRQIREK